MAIVDRRVLSLVWDGTGPAVSRSAASRRLATLVGRAWGTVELVVGAVQSVDCDCRVCCVTLWNALLLRTARGAIHSPDRRMGAQQCTYLDASHGTSLLHDVRGYRPVPVCTVESTRASMHPVVVSSCGAELYRFLFFTGRLKSDRISVESFETVFEFVRRADKAYPA